MLALIWRVVKEKANTIAVQRRSRVVFLLTRVSENSLRTSCSVGKNINMCSVMSRLHVAKNTWSFKMCKGSLQFQRMRATQASMSTFCRPPLPTPPHSRRILQRLPKRRRFGTSTCPLFLELLTCLVPLFLASTVSALHRNAHIWNASHPLLVTYYCWVTVYSPGMEAKKSNIFVSAGNRISVS